MENGVNTPAQSDDEKKVLRQAKNRFMRAFEAKRTWFASKDEWSAFYDGNQWTEEEKEILRNRNQPDVVINRIKPKIDSIGGMQIAMPVNMRAYPRGSMDFEKAKHITEALRKVENDSNFDTVENDGFLDQMIDGLGWYETILSFNGLDAETRTILVDNGSIFEDPDSVKNDLSDAKDVSKSKWMHLEDAVELWPHAKEDLEGFVANPLSTVDDELTPHAEKKPDQYKNSPEMDEFVSTHFADKKLKRLRVTEQQYRVPFKETLLTAPELGQVIKLSDFADKESFEKEFEKVKEMFPKAIKWDQIRYKVHTCIFTWNKLLEHKKDVRHFDVDGKFTLTMIPGFRERKRKNFFYGLVKQMMDPQREVNKRRSKMMHLLNSNQVILEDGAVEDVEATRREVAKPDGVIKLRSGQFRFELNKQTDLAASQFQLLQESKQEIDQVGVRGEVEGQSRATSGRDFQLRQQQAVQSMRKLLANLRDARKRVAQLWLDNIQQYWTAEMFIKVSDDPDAEGMTLNERVIDPITGEEKIVNDVSVGKYDIILDEAPESINLESENFENILKLAEIGAKTGQQVPFDMIVELSPFPNKKKLLERMAQMQQQQMQMQQMALQAQAAGQQPAQ